MTPSLSLRADLFRIASWHTAKEGPLSGVRVAPCADGVVLAAAGGTGPYSFGIRIWDTEGWTDKPCTLAMSTRFLNQTDDLVRLTLKRGTPAPMIDVAGLYASLDVKTSLRTRYTLIDDAFPVEAMDEPNDPTRQQYGELPTFVQKVLSNTTYALGRAAGMDANEAAKASAQFHHHADGALVFTFPFFSLKGEERVRMFMRGSKGLVKPSRRLRAVEAA